MSWCSTGVYLTLEGLLPRESEEEEISIGIFLRKEACEDVIVG
jgi:hypothetical protein